jgi:hypothetical protein
MLGQGNLRLGEPLDHAVLDHGTGALGCFLTRLEYGHHRSAPQVPILSQDSRHPHQPGDVHIVPAGMGDRCSLAEAIGSGLVTRVS